MRRKLGGRGPYLDYENSVKGASVGMLICTYSLNQLAGQFVSQLSVSVVNHAWETCVVGLLSETKVQEQNLFQQFQKPGKAMRFCQKLDPWRVVSKWRSGPPGSYQLEFCCENLSCWFRVQRQMAEIGVFQAARSLLLTKRLIIWDSYWSK